MFPIFLRAFFTKDASCKTEIQGADQAPGAAASLPRRQRLAKIVATIAVAPAIALAAAPTASYAAAPTPGGNNSTQASSYAPGEISMIERLSAEYLAKTYGLSFKEALSRVRAQPKHTANAQRFQKKFGDRITGTFIDQKRGKLIVNVADKKTASKIRGCKVEVHVVGVTASGLEGIRTEAEKRLGGKLNSASVDASRAMVVIDVSEEDLESSRAAVKDLKRVEITSSGGSVSIGSAPVK
ncbi:hypothetical protein SAMN05421595_1208 [Austwickia chelonae]|uniref:Uncharacterized protein n=1 Tax=Austwickia chelonae NBRC 105200 TaxID=1184607 RepID=K6VPT1_9MICO|nr:hypothetical protein [Austwickia chelonae]GAB77380.1 hypothetical protein AUCHE_05_02890 [Austwickia chelonae NBRC 105200]SEW09124.1 hypothetical protein SAMN05421595_1208 [Austwickia chelonae]